MKKDDLLNKEFIYKFRSLIGLLILVIILSLLSPRFLTFSNLTNVLRQTSLNAIIAVGMTFVILTGGIDLSVGSILALSSAVTAGLLVEGYSVVIAVLIGLIIGGVIGAFNGIVITRGKIPPFITTLAVMTLVRGATLVYTGGQPITGLGTVFRKIGTGYIPFINIPVPVIVMLFIFLIAYYTLSQTRFGRYVYALGGNEEAARLSGINTNRVKTMVYSISGMLAALSGIILTSRLNSAQPTAGEGYELDAIAAVVLGGSSLSGGKGSIGGTLIGALIIGILNNGLNLLDVSPFYQLMAKGAVILLAVLLDKNK
ncbi:ribose ABC transporter permease [Natronincola ferrireducens]|uniref:Ribose ABC transporter membrane protein n=1 Tax=Natronincola ferrireducens TaxID=393762 RepID=A0A1G9GTE8_9FIRM|nr:ribose ABC transporter permease [Natronincola ferrireducens]SDL03947.1 ribose ABC transporter membrane protein [Natronincola ferrireducens]